MERRIKSFEVTAEATHPFIYTIEVGKEFGGQAVDDIIEHDGVFKLFNRKDELITEINLPVVGVKYVYPSYSINYNRPLFADRSPKNFTTLIDILFIFNPNMQQEDK
ncbi:hypothetical protein [Peribacillus frigoritolerans]|uniref:hypothetical protein n=1 Tax=Peribacillus frigoritolerans TaxID=450367 RepID=UPI00330599D6